MTEPTHKELLAEGVTAHAKGNLGEAVALRWRAVDAMQPTDPEYPGALGTAAFTERLLGNFGIKNLVELGDLAYDQAQTNIGNEADYDAKQLALMRNEVPSIAMHSAVLHARFGALQEQRHAQTLASQSYDLALKRMDEAWEGMKALPRWHHSRTITLTHQHVINAARRRSAIEALHPKGSSKKALAYAGLATAMSPLSESPHFTANTDPSGPAFNAKAKAKALAGGAQAIRFAMLSTIPGAPMRREMLRLAQGSFLL